jgi:hypothetical protein
MTTTSTTITTTTNQPLIHGSNISIGIFMRQLELTTSRKEFSQAVKLITSLLREERIPTHKRFETMVSLNVATVCIKLAQLLGPQLIMDTLQTCMTDCFVAMWLNDYDSCKQCGARDRILRSYCLECGIPVDCYFTSSNLLFVDSYRLPKSCQQLLQQFTSPGFHGERLECIRRSLIYFASCLKADMFRKNPGDMIFLCLKGWCALRGHDELETIAKQATLDGIERWKRDICDVFSNEDGEQLNMKVLLDSMESLHAIAFSAQLLESQGEYEAAKQILSPVAGIVRVSMNGTTTRTLGSTTTTSNTNIMDQNLTILTQIIPKISKTLWSFDLNDATGFDPKDCTSQGPPMTPPSHCSNCGEEDNAKDATSCLKCSQILECKLDYGAMTDAWVWAFIFDTLGVRLACQSRSARAELRVEDLLNNHLLGAFRKYQSLADLGRDFWKLQCYWATHYIYVQSNWGCCALRREYYLEEFELFATSLSEAIMLNDPELVGEFLHCLRILEYVPGVVGNEELDQIYQIGVAYLVDTEKKFGSKGMFVPDNKSQYTRYHAAWTGIVGLLLNDEFGLSHHPFPFSGSKRDPLPCWYGFNGKKGRFELW